MAPSSSSCSSSRTTHTHTPWPRPSCCCVPRPALPDCPPPSPPQTELGCGQNMWRWTLEGYLREILTARVYDVAVSAVWGCGVVWWWALKGGG